MGASQWVAYGARIAPERRRVSGARPRPDDSGITLIEMVVTIAIVGVAITGLVGAMGSTVRMSNVAAGGARVEAEARRVAEAVRAAPLTNCPGPPPVSLPANGGNAAYYNCVIRRVSPVPAGWTAQTTSVECGSFLGTNPQFAAPNTPCGSMPNFQRVTIKVTAPGAVTTSVRFVKRRP